MLDQFDHADRSNTRCLPGAGAQQAAYVAETEEDDGPQSPRCGGAGGGSGTDDGSGAGSCKQVLLDEHLMYKYYMDGNVAKQDANASKLIDNTAFLFKQQDIDRKNKKSVQTAMAMRVEYAPSIEELSLEVSRGCARPTCDC
jgi:hypothetical protein